MKLFPLRRRTHVMSLQQARPYSFLVSSHGDASRDKKPFNCADMIPGF